MTAAGVCHSDEYFMSLPAEKYTFGLPLTLGHEGAGIVAGLGAGRPRHQGGGPGRRVWGMGLRALQGLRDRRRELLPECRRVEDPMARLRCPGLHGRVHARPEIRDTSSRSATSIRSGTYL